MALWPQTQAKPLAGIEDVRARYAALFDKFAPPPAAMDFSPARLGAISGEWVGAARQEPGRTILYFHGGGFVAGSPLTHRAVVGRLVEASGVSAFAVQYRTAREAFFPAPVRDGIDAYRALIARGIRAGSIILAGDEAGGGLAFAVALAARKANLPMPGGIVALSPWADLSLSGYSMLCNRKADTVLDWDLLFLSARYYLRKSNPCDVYASSCYASLTGFPPIMVHAGANEILRDDASKLGDRAADSNVAVSVEIYDGMGHLFQLDGARNEAKVSLGRLGQFIRTKSAAMAAA